MNFANSRLAIVAAFALLSGCASRNPSLTFGDSTTFGLRLGNDTATGGASFALGYKAQSVALVPITYNDDDGSAKTLKADGGGMSDAMSVFAVFESKAPAGATAGAKSVGLGQIFSTGLAAQEITRGICKAQHSEQCADSKPPAEQAASEAAKAAQSAAVAANAAADRLDKLLTAGLPPKAAGAAPVNLSPEDGPYQRPLVFMRTDVFGFEAGGSLAEKGLQFVLGYTNRNLAFIPTTAWGVDGRVGRITGGEVANGQAPRDTLSVVGQFKADTQTGRLGYELSRYFATGVAARNLGRAAGAAAAAAANTPQPAASAASQTGN